MPYKKRYRRRRKPTRRYRSRAKRLQVARPKRTLFGNSQVVKLRYVYIGQIALSGGVPVPLSFRANGPYYPHVGGIVEQPRGWDQLVQLWKNNTVTHSKCRVNFMPEGFSEPGDHHPVICYLQVAKEPETTLLAPRDALESRHVAARPWAAGQGARGCTLTKTFNTARFFTCNDVLDSHIYAGTAGSAPTSQGLGYFNLSFSPTHAHIHDPCDIIVTIDYTIVFHGPIQPAAS